MSKTCSQLISTKYRQHTNELVYELSQEYDAAWKAVHDTENPTPKPKDK